MLLRSGASLLILAAALVLAANALAQQRVELEGTYRLAVTHDQARETIDRAIDRAVEDMGRIAEHFAGKQLQEKLRVADPLAIAIEDGFVRIRFGENTLRIRQGSFGSLTTPDGEPARARARVDGARLVVEWRTERGVRRDTFLRRENGTLRLSVRVTGDGLPDAVQYHLDYRRDESRDHPGVAADGRRKSSRSADLCAEILPKK